MRILALKLGCQADSIIRFVYQPVILFQVGSVVQLFSSVLCHLFVATFAHEGTHSVSKEVFSRVWRKVPLSCRTASSSTVTRDTLN